MKSAIAKRVVCEFKAGDVINLGIGIPTLIMDHIPADLDIWIHSEGGVMGITRGYHNESTIDAGNNLVGLRSGASFFDSSMSFAMIRKGHIDIAVIGAFEVDRLGNIANHALPGEYISGIGGAMDLITGAKRVIVAMTQYTKHGDSKIRDRCTLPVTGRLDEFTVFTEAGKYEYRKGFFYDSFL